MDTPDDYRRWKAQRAGRWRCECEGCDGCTTETWCSNQNKIGYFMCVECLEAMAAGFDAEPTVAGDDAPGTEIAVREGGGAAPKRNAKK